MSVFKYSVRKPKGQSFRYSLESDHVGELDTLQCVHCQMHWEYKPGSGRVRSWCKSCDGPLCAEKPNCVYPCERSRMHWERQQETRVKEAQKIIVPGE